MAILTVTIQEELVLNGRNFNVSNISTFSATEVIHRMVDLTTAEKSVVLFASENEAGTIKDAQLSYLRITNLDDTTAVNLRIRNASEEYFVQVVPGGSFILTEDKLDADATGSEETISLAQIDSIKGASASGSLQIEVFATS